MKQKNLYFIGILMIFMLVFTSVVNAAEEDMEIEVFGFELEKLLSLLSGILALILFAIAFIAYNRDGRKRLLFVSVAFLLFAVKSFLVSAELFIPEIPLIDPIAIILEFARV